MIGKTLFGYDIFISYSRKDSVDYALQLAQILIEEGFACYLDQLSSNTPGEKLPQPIKNTLRRCTAFVIIGSKGAQHSEAIAEEVQTFLKMNNRNPVIPVNINGAIYEADWFPAIKGLAMVDESAENFKAEKPSEVVISRISNACTFTKKNTRLRNITMGFATISLVIIGIALLGLWQANNAGKKAERLNKENIAAQDTIAIKQESIKRLENTYEAKKKQLDLSNLALQGKQNELARAQQNIDRLDTIGRSSALIAKGAKLADRKPNEAIEYLKQALKLNNDPQILAVALSMSDKALCTHELRLGSKIVDIDVSQDQAYAAVLTEDKLLILNLHSFASVEVNVLNRAFGGNRMVKFLDDGNLLFTDAYLNLYKTREQKIIQLDSSQGAEYTLSTSSNYYIKRISENAYLMPVKGGNPVLLNRKLGMNRIGNVGLSNSGKYMVVRDYGNGYTLLCDASANIIDTLKGVGSVYFAPDETFLVNIDFGKLWVYFFKNKRTAYESVGWLTPDHKVYFSSLYPYYFLIWENNIQRLWLVTGALISDVSTNGNNMYSFMEDGRMDQASLFIRNKWSGKETAIRDFDGIVSDFVRFDYGKKVIAGDDFGAVKIFDFKKLGIYKTYYQDMVHVVTSYNYLFQVYSDSLVAVKMPEQKKLRTLKLSVKVKYILTCNKNRLLYWGANDELMGVDLTTYVCKQLMPQKIAYQVRYDKAGILYFKAKDGNLYIYNLSTGRSKKLFGLKGQVVISKDGKYIGVFKNHPKETLFPISITPGTFTFSIYNTSDQKKSNNISRKGHIRFADFNHLNQLVLGIEQRGGTYFYTVDSTGQMNPFNFLQNHPVKQPFFDFVRTDYSYSGTMKSSMESFFERNMLNYLVPGEKAVLVKDPEAKHKCWYWDIYTNSTSSLMVSTNERIEFFNISPDYENVVICTGKTIYLYNTVRKKIVKLREFYSEVSNISLSHNGKYFLAYDGMKIYSLYAIDGTFIKSFEVNSEGCFFTNDDQYVMVKNRDLTVSYWPINTETILYK